MLASLTTHALRWLTAAVIAALPGNLAAAGVEIELRHTVAGQPMKLDSLRYEKAANEVFSVSRLSYLISGIAFQRADGTWCETKLDAAWIDVGKRRTAFHIEGVPAGEFRAIRFSVGLDQALNHSDPAGYPAGHALNPAVNHLHWTWQGGYIFLALEGHYRSDKQRRGFSLHFARGPNRTEINLPAKIVIAEAARISLDFDIAALLETPRPIAFARDGASTHSREQDALAAMLKTNLPGAFRVGSVSAPPPIEPIAKRKPLFLPTEPKSYPFKMGSTFPMPQLPEDNPLLKGRVALGEAIFSDTKLSRTGRLSCASCHHTDKAFTDGSPVSVGVDDRVGDKNSMPLFNLAWKDKFFWDGRAPSLRAQVLMPIESHVELDENLDRVVAKLSADADYAPRFERAFGAPQVTAEKIALSLEAFLLTLTSYDSKFDRAMAGQAELTSKEKRGFELFMTEYEPRAGRYGADCFHCHGGALFSNHGFHHNGLPGVNERFSTPSLRNVALTAPYMHDGRFGTLAEVVAHYSSGVQHSKQLDPNLAKHPRGGLNLSAEDQAALVAFLESLTDPKYASRP